MRYAGESLLCRCGGAMAAELHRTDKPGRNARARQKVRQRVYFSEQETAELAELGTPRGVIEQVVRVFLARRRMEALGAAVSESEA